MTNYTAAEIALIEAGRAAGETAIFLGYTECGMARYYYVGGL